MSFFSTLLNIEFQRLFLKKYSTRVKSNFMNFFCFLLTYNHHLNSLSVWNVGLMMCHFEQNRLVRFQFQATNIIQKSVWDAIMRTASENNPVFYGVRMFIFVLIKPTTRRYPEPDEPSPHFHTLSFLNVFYPSSVWLKVRTILTRYELKFGGLTFKETESDSKRG
jgi:hypothetical protein